MAKKRNKKFLLKKTTKLSKKRGKKLRPKKQRISKCPECFQLCKKLVTQDGLKMCQSCKDAYLDDILEDDNYYELTDGFNHNPATVNCPSCGAGNAVGKNTCWKCRWEFNATTKPYFGKSLVRNPDNELRDLERKTLAGDEQAAIQLYHLRLRMGLTPTLPKWSSPDYAYSSSNKRNRRIDQIRYRIFESYNNIQVLNEQIQREEKLLAKLIIEELLLSQIEQPKWLIPFWGGETTLPKNPTSKTIFRCYWCESQKMPDRNYSSETKNTSPWKCKDCHEIGSWDDFCLKL